MTLNFRLVTFVPCATLLDGKKNYAQNPHNKQSDRIRQIQNVSSALQQWRYATKSTLQQMPTDNQLRACPVAARLHLRSRILNAGGYTQVSKQLNIPRSKSHRVLAREKTIAKLATELNELCIRKGFPSPYDDFPSRKAIRSLSSSLANKIEMFPSRRGYSSLCQYFQNQKMHSTTTKSSIMQSSALHQDVKKPSQEPWGKWVDIAFILDHIVFYQAHPRVMPPLKQLPPPVIQAIHRQGGSSAFAAKAQLVLHKNFHNIQLWSALVKWLASEVISSSMAPSFTTDPEKYAILIVEQSQNPPSFPSTEIIREAGFLNHVTRFGGRKVLALRLGFSPNDGMAGLVMSKFSVQFAADILEYAVAKAIPTSDGSVAMPTIRNLKEDNMHHLAAAVEIFRGEAVVGRRVGLVFGMSLN